MLDKLKKYLLTAVLIGTAFLFPGRPVLAETADAESGETLLTATYGFHSTVLTDGDGSSGNDGVGVNGSSGVAELDNAANRTNTLINWICGWIGGIMALFGFIWAAMNQAGHNTEARNMGIIVAAVGIVIAFAPRIVNFILGR